jgi:hydroxypyruvate reductase
MSRSRLLADAQEIWHAGLAGVRSERLMRDAVQLDDHWLVIDEEANDLDPIRRIAVVGGGKAGAGMAAELEAILGERLLAEKIVEGWVNVPADCVRALARIHLHAARPAGLNEPTEAGVHGAEKILRIVGSLGADDLCLVLISGGGSALMPAPVEGVSLTDKAALTRFLSAAGANIAELNAVRKPLSRIKGGGLARHCRAGRLIALVISDVLGDPLDVIASGATVVDSSAPDTALEVLARFGAIDSRIAPSAVEYLRRQATPPTLSSKTECAVRNVIIGNNAMAVDAAGVAAERLGYSAALVAATKLEGAVEEISRHLAQMAIKMRDGDGPDCLISGGEGTVALAPESERGLGGRNQQLVLAALEELLHRDPKKGRGIAILSGGTDGEDGPTDAAGAWLDEQILSEVQRRGLNATDYLRRNDAYHFFEPLGALLETGPTHTNVCDVRVVMVDKHL